MGYNTQFEGKLKFTQKLTAAQLKALNKICGEDCRQHPEWKAEGLTWMDLRVDGDGLVWNGSEKTYDLVEKVNLILDLMHKRWAKFGLEGTIKAQGESMGDIWSLTIKDGRAVRKAGW